MTAAHRVWHLMFKLLAGLVVLLCLTVGIVGLVLPIIPGLLFLAFAAFIGARYVLPGERPVSSHPTAGKEPYGQRRFSFSRITLSRLTLGERLRLGGLLAAKAVVDGVACFRSDSQGRRSS